MTVAIYIRVSTEEQAQQGYSIESQKERLTAYCISQGWDDFKLYIDDGYTGTNMNRPALNRLIRHIEDKQIETVVVYKLDRLSRKQLDVLHLLEKVFEKNGVAFKSSTEPFDTSTPLGKAMLGILAVFAQLERDMIVERTTEGRRQRINQGLWYGGQIPFGYSWNKEAQRLEIVPEEARIIQEIYKQYLQGKSRLEIAEWAAERTTARVIDHSVVRDILARPIYIGKLANAGTLVDGKHEPIIDFETWYAVQRETEKRKEGLPPVGEYLLTGLLECGVCGGPVVHVRRKQVVRGKEYIYQLYACKNQHVRTKERTIENCSLGYQRRKDIEEFVISQIRDIALNPTKLNKIREQKEQPRDNTEAAEALREKLQKVIDGLENLYEAIQTGEIKVQYVSSRIKKLEEEREAIERQLDDIQDEEPRYKSLENVHYLIKEVSTTWDYLTLDEQKIVLRQIVKKITLQRKAEPIIEWNIIE